MCMSVLNIGDDEWKNFYLIFTPYIPVCWKKKSDWRAESQRASPHYSTHVVVAIYHEKVHVVIAYEQSTYTTVINITSYRNSTRRWERNVKSRKKVYKKVKRKHLLRREPIVFLVTRGMDQLMYFLFHNMTLHNNVCIFLLNSLTQE